MMYNGSFIMFLAKIVDDIILAGPDTVTDKVLTKCNAEFELWSIVSSPENLRFNGINIQQCDHYSIEVIADDKIVRMMEN